MGFEKRMTRELAKELLPILSSWAEGKELELRYKKSLPTQAWSRLEMDNPDFDRDDLEWRVRAQEPED